MAARERTWMVRANSFARRDYAISGSNLRDAVLRNVGRILSDVAPWAAERDVLAVDLRWRADILRGAGGAEVEIAVALGGNMTHFVAWIGAAREETPEIAVWLRSGSRMEMVRAS